MTHHDPADRVRPLGPEKEHYWLALSMAQAIGLDLQAEIDASRFSLADWAEAVRRCRGCDWARQCPGWLAAHSEADHAPGTCANADRFNALLGVEPPAEPAHPR